MADAKEGLNKPEEDVVPYSICRNAYDSIVDYLSIFLISSGCELPTDHTVRSLLTACRKAETQFQSLHLSPLYDPTQTEDLWMNLDMANDFIAMAEMTRDKVYTLIKVPY